MKAFGSRKLGVWLLLVYDGQGAVVQVGAILG